MPRLVKGAKWTYGWVLVGPEYKVTIPPEAWSEYGFEAGGEATLLPGSQRSGGFSLSTRELMRQAVERTGGRALRELGRGWFGKERDVVLPPACGVVPGDRLLTVRGSCYGLGFVARGPIYETALQHPELVCYE